jgi:para-nitrobenzyl esterase
MQRAWGKFAWARWSFFIAACVAGCDDDATEPLAGDGSTVMASDAATADAATPAGDAGPELPPNQVEIETGRLEGSVDDGIHKFLGIPYAAPPTGALRWRRPQPVEKWSGVKAASEFGPRCAQNESTTLMNAASTDEDCLYLNVWTPDLAPDEPLSVMVWIHGGGNQNGSANEPVPYANAGLFYTGQFLAKNQRVVVVSLNYRLGWFGFLNHPALDAEEGGTSGNQGLWDQQAALAWVQQNIAKFGGDPKNVTIFGESAGSLDVCFHVASPESRGLFHKAISQSGGCTTKNSTKAEGEQQAQTLASALGCAGDTPLACLRGKSVAELLGQMGRPGPVVDGEFLPKQARELFDAGDVAKVPYMLGSNTDEGTLFSLGQAVATEDELKAALGARLMTTELEPILAQYPLSSFMSEPNPQQARLARILGDAQLVCSTWDSAVRAQQAGFPGVWMYNFDVPVVIASLPSLMLGATHGAELVYVFQTSPAFEAADTALSDKMQAYWANFAKTGDPNGGGQLEWPKFSEETSTRLNFAREPSVVQAFRKSECTFWRLGYDRQFAAN